MELEIKGAQNARDLGGICVAGGKRIKMGRIIRSSNLSKLEVDGVELLKSYNLKRVVDFRSLPEIELMPDYKIEGVAYDVVPILKSLTVGVSRHKDKSKVTMEELVLDITLDLGKDAKKWLKKLYIPLVTDEFSVNGYRKFFDILKENKEGAVLYHCAAGKDRVGTGTALFLLAMGASYEDVASDYLLTNKSVEKSTALAIKMAEKMGMDKALIKNIPAINGVDREYIEVVFDVISEYGGIEKYLEKMLGINKDYLEELRKNYLE